MMLPIPTNKIKFHDSTPYADFLYKISEAVMIEEMKGTRGNHESKGFESVGMYKMKTVAPENVISTLLELKQPIQKWLYKMIETYAGWQWLFVIIPEGKAMSSQPLLIEFDQIGRAHV